MAVGLQSSSDWSLLPGPLSAQREILRWGRCVAGGDQPSIHTGCVRAAASAGRSFSGHIVWELCFWRRYTILYMIYAQKRHVYVLYCFVFKNPIITTTITIAFHVFLLELLLRWASAWCASCQIHTLASNIYACIYRALRPRNVILLTAGRMEHSAS